MHFVGPYREYLISATCDAPWMRFTPRIPRCLRARQRKVLAGYGLNPTEIKSFRETPLLLSPTRQEAARGKWRSRFDGVAGRDELFRHAMSLTSEEEVQVFLQSAGLLDARAMPAGRLPEYWPDCGLPTAQFSDGRIVVVGSFDAVYWTADVEGYESALHAALSPVPKRLGSVGVRFTYRRPHAVN